MQLEADLKPKGELGLRVIKGGPHWPERLDTRMIAKLGYPQRGLSEEVNDWRSDNVKRSPWLRGIRDHYVAELASKVGLAHIEGLLFGKVIRGEDGSELELGLMGLNIVTTAGVGFVCDAWRNTVELEIMKYHGIGTGSTSELVGDTALQTELTTQLNPDSTRATGTLAGSSNTFTTVATNTVDSGVTLREWGLLSQAATGGGTLFDRVTYAAVGLASGDSIQTTFSATFPGRRIRVDTYGALDLDDPKLGSLRHLKHVRPDNSDSDFRTVRVGIPYPIGYHRNGDIIWSMEGGADGPFYRDTRMQSVIVADDSTITLATTQKALWTYAKSILPANYFAFVGKTVKLTAQGWATTDGTAGNYVAGIGYGSSDAPTALAAGVARAGITGVTAESWMFSFYVTAQASGASGALRGWGGIFTADLALMLSTAGPNVIPATTVANTTVDTTAGTNSVMGTLQRSGAGVWTAATAGLVMEALN